MADVSSFRVGVCAWQVFVSFLFFSVNALINQPHSAHEMESRSSISRNVHGKCNIKIINANSLEHKIRESRTVLATMFPPATTQLKEFAALPHTLTKSDGGLSKAALDKGYLKWSTERKPLWNAPREHILQNRKYCFNTTLNTAQGKAVSLYDAYKEVKSSFYLLYKKNVVIHFTGAVGFDCGYFEGSEGCETRWGQKTQAWKDKLDSTLTENTLQWDDIFPSSHHPLSTAIASVTGTVNNRDSGNVHAHATAKGDTMNNRHTTAIDVVTQASVDESRMKIKGLNSTYLFTVTQHNSVFVIDAFWDFNYNHFITDSLARLIHHLPYLRENKDIMIHIRACEEYDKTVKSESFKESARLMRNRLFEILGIEKSRVIWGTVMAKEVFIPRCMYCAYALSNPIEIRLLAFELLERSRAIVVSKGRHVGDIASNIMDSSGDSVREVSTGKTVKQINVYTVTAPEQQQPQKTIIIQQRYNRNMNGHRSWSNDTFNRVANAFAEKFPQHKIIKITSLTASSPDFCLACEIVQYSEAEILVGDHGAGLTNSIFMNPGSIIVEFTGDFKVVSMPVCGYYGPLAVVNGQHHYLHAYNYKEDKDMRLAEAVEGVRGFYDDLRGGL